MFYFPIQRNLNFITILCPHAVKRCVLVSGKLD